MLFNWLQKSLPFCHPIKVTLKTNSDIGICFQLCFHWFTGTVLLVIGQSDHFGFSQCPVTKLNLQNYITCKNSWTILLTLGKFKQVAKFFVWNASEM